MIVRELLTKLGFVVDEKKLAAFDKRVAKLKSSLSSLAKWSAVVGGAVTGLAFSTAKAGDEIAKTSRRLGINTQALQEWRFAAERAGVGARTFDMAMQRFGRRASEAARGQGEAKDALAEMGIQLTDVNGELRDADTLLMESLVALSKQEKEWDRNRLAMKLFDSEGVRMVQLAEEGAEGIALLRKTLRARGGVMDKATIKASEEFNDSWTDLKATLLGVRNVLGKELLPIFIEVFDVMGKWIAENHKLITLIVKIVAGIGTLIVIVKAATVATWAFGAAWAFVNSQIFLIPLLIIAAILAIVLLVEDIVAFTKGKDSVFGRMVASFEKGWKIAGDKLKKVFSEAWASVKTKALTIWKEIVDGIGLLWTDFRKKHIDPILDVFRTIRGLGRGITGGIPGGVRAAAVGPAASKQVIGEVAGTIIVNIALAPPPGTTERGTAREIVSALRSARHLTSTIMGLGK